MRSGGYDWRYPAAGLGWGAVVGTFFGAAVARVATLAAVPAVAGDQAFTALSLLVFAPFLGAVYGVVPGAVTGLVTGAAVGLAVGRSQDRRRARLVAGATALAVQGTGLAGLLAADPGPATVDPGGTAALLVPVALGAGLMAWTSGSIIEAAERRALSRSSAAARSG